MYTYRIVKENWVTGIRAKRTRTITKNRPLEIGGLYLHLGKGYPGAYRVLELIEEVQDDEEAGTYGKGCSRDLLHIREQELPDHTAAE